ncbi:hypothetical protein M8C21_021054 [Ambrosia artemisiifolia]|uniref:Uncharacterized protein n=1 Tax=Ambrosia artemisiifolia TaxID=4212 RepID=A0AAD5D9S7_AMBAR|nr:hypothetical protein M8C21_021054 [Ambrosia artemisiifolia]
MSNNNTTTTDTKGRCLVLLPLPFQGHLSPMLQLANILHSKGFSITILHTSFNSPNPNNYPHFNYVPIPDTSEANLCVSSDDVGKVIRFMHDVNINLVDPIRGCLERLMSEDKGVACLITDAQWSCTQSVAEGLKLPRIVHRTSNISSFRSFAAYPASHDKGCVQSISDEETKSKALVPGLESLKVEALPKFHAYDAEVVSKVIERMVQATKRAHAYFATSSSSLLEQDKTSLSWLNKYPPKSVLYVSFGSIVKVDESQFLEIAWGLANSKQPFLWVVRPRSIEGSEWLEPLPNGFLDRIVEGRGYIVKWAPQQDVLAHPAIGGFWTHNGWNSTLESICEGVPMICSPSFGDQIPNARHVSNVWKIGVELEHRFKRREIESAIKKVMVDDEGLQLRNKIIDLKQIASFCLKKGGSSYSSLEDLVNYILSF